MSSLAFVTHPSVRIKGTENSYTPTQCLDDRCPVKAPHLHCPFCVKTDAYQDPVILKAHYRVKHVDKGIEFAGLKILRCCDQCDIIGIIKGEKRFKGAHWHCYRCRNGFNRRDEAIKHYKTHFRNPQTTFQIQITQDLNSPPEVRPHDDHSSSQDAFASIENPVQEIIHPAMSQTAISLSEQNVITTGAVGNRHGGSVQKIKVKHELLGKEEGPDHEDEETIMIIQGEPLESAFASHIINSGELTALNKTGVDPNLSWEIRCRMEEEEKNIFKSKAEEYKAQVELLQQQVANLEAQLAQQSQLKLHELIENLNSGDTNKQGLGQQLSKFLEQCQMHPSHGSVTIIEDDSQPHVPQEEHLEAADHIIQDLDHNPGSLSEQLETNASQLETNAAVSHLSEIPEGFQVICTTSEGHVVVTRADSAVTPSTVEGGTIISLETSNGDNSSSAPAVATTAAEADQALFTQVISAQNKEEEDNSMLAHVSADTAGQEFGGDLSQVEQGDLTDVADGQGCLMEVVDAADGLASLGTDVNTATDPSGDKENGGTFVVEIGGGQKILVQGTEETSNSGDENSRVNQSEQSTEEPAPKRARIT